MCTISKLLSTHSTRFCKIQLKGIRHSDLIEFQRIQTPESSKLLWKLLSYPIHGSLSAEKYLSNGTLNTQQPFDLFY